ncbi:hypothetical protein Pfo_013848 [Paulownia fortunei]|nr:hypothetical protein Pfo_013848 [Paulownia fortunei]
MDMKALAKSKRAHSLHHSKKHHPRQASKEPSIGSGNQKPTEKQAKEKPTKSHGSRPLPSNWERYDEDFDLGSEEAQSSSNQPTEFVVPKSKGADYAHLISEAKAQPQANYSSDVFPLFDNFIYDFTQDFGPMLAAKGQSILSWIADDIFEFEGKASTTVEAPFLSLNLNALAKQLAKTKLSERLFLEPDILPLELLDDELQACGEDKHDPQTCTSAAETDSGASSLSYNEEVSKNVQRYHEPVSSPITVTANIPVQNSEEGLKPIKQNMDEILQSQVTERSISPKSISERIVDSTAGNPPIFEAASVEAELDMLLSSFSETNVLESTSASSTEIPSVAAVSGKTVKQGTHMMKPANIDDDIDNLLEETSYLTKTHGRRLSNGVEASPDDITSTMHPSSKSKLLDDFDSWLDTI